MTTTDLKLRMENYVRGSAQIAIGQRTNNDILEKISGKAIWKVSFRFINNNFIDEFIANEMVKLEGLKVLDRSAEGLEEEIFHKWEKAFGKAVYDQFDDLELTKSEHVYRENAKSIYKMWE